jgi:hypothetical protein
MSVFLRWGIFGILGVAALLYAYNASKRMAEQHAAKSSPAAAQAPTNAVAGAAVVPMPAPDYEGLTPPCRLELEVAYLAVMARNDGDPFDRVLRMQKIAWQDDAKIRERLTQVARRWYGRTGAVDPVQMRDAVALDCARNVS